MKNTFTLHVNDDGTARLIFDLPGEKVNKFSTSVMLELEKVLLDLKERTDIKIMSIESGKQNIFIAGADIAELEKITDKEEAVEKAAKGQAIFNLLEKLPFPTVAVIDGACMGGGLECALACTYRMATDNKKTVLGCPEVQLGILPGWGGTQRLPRLVGLMAALPMILGGAPVKPSKAYRMKLVDQLAAHEFLAEQAADFMKKCLTDKGKSRILKARKRKGLMNAFLEKTIPGRILLFSRAEKDVRHKTHGHYPAPLKALEVVEHSFGGSLTAGLAAEAAAFGELAITPICKNLITLFYTSEELKKDPGVKEKVKPRDVSDAGVIGAGVMGGGIGWLLSSGDISVRMKDINWDAVAHGFASASSCYGQMLKRRKLTPGQVNVKMHSITGTTDYTGFKNLDIVVEAIVENIGVKKKVFGELEDYVAEDTIICSNTSALSIDEMAADLKHPERLLGMHFFNPVNRMPLVEVIPCAKTDPINIATVCALVKRLKKTPVVVQNCAGFLVNRILLPYMIESVYVCEEGTDFERIDKVFRNFGMPMGPFLLADEVGLDVGFKVAAILADAYKPRMGVAELLRLIYEDEHLLGAKAGKGFYIHNGKKREINPDVSGWVGNIQEKRAITPVSLSNNEIIDRGILIMLNEAVRCLEEKVIEKPAYLDMALIMGIGFPPWRGGLLRYADERGISECRDQLEKLADKCNERFRPCKLLTEMAKENKRFYE